MKTGRPLIDIAGQRFGRLTALEREGSTPAGNAKWRCRCDCEAIVHQSASSLRRGTAKSCGCARNEAIGNANRRHGMYKSPTYVSWKAMRNRCANLEFKWHFGKGVTVCTRWELFDNFYADMGERPKGKTLDRWPNHEGNYEPANCRWASAIEQHRNKSNNRWIEFQGQRLCVTEWAQKTGLSSSVIYDRLNKGWMPERALTTHPIPYGARNHYASWLAKQKPIHEPEPA